jgi:MarR family transcriptional regulator for hemolysin
MGYLMNRAARLLRQLADRRLKPFGLSSGHLPVLTELMRQPEMSQKDLTEAAGIEQPTMAEMLARMDRDGIIRRRPDPGDRRSTLISLSPSTLANLPRIKATIQSMNRDALGALPEKEREPFREKIAVMIGALEALMGEKVTAKAAKRT